jgi:hypothetical protein
MSFATRTSDYAAYWEVKDWMDKDYFPWFKEWDEENHFNNVDDLLFKAFNIESKLHKDLLIVINEHHPWFWGPHGPVLFKALLIRRGIKT